MKNLFNNHGLIVAPVTFAPAGAMTPSAEFLFTWWSEDDFDTMTQYLFIGSKPQN